VFFAIYVGLGSLLMVVMSFLFSLVGALVGVGSLRVGTFNVNGKLPSQDLASWIRGALWAGAGGGATSTRGSVDSGGCSVSTLRFWYMAKSSSTSCQPPPHLCHLNLQRRPMTTATTTKQNPSTPSRTRTCSCSVFKNSIYQPKHFSTPQAASEKTHGPSLYSPP
jgi:hypothetical protein